MNPARKYKIFIGGLAAADKIACTDSIVVFLVAVGCTLHVTTGFSQSSIVQTPKFEPIPSYPSSTLGHKLMDDGQWTLAKKLYDEALKLHLDNVNARFERARTSEKLLDIDGAIGDLIYVKNKFPSIPSSYISLSRILAEQGKKIEALDLTKEGVRLERASEVGTALTPDYEEARLRELSGDVDGAERLLKECAEKSLPRTVAYKRYELGQFYDRQGRLKDALQQYEISYRLASEGRIGFLALSLRRAAMCQIALGDLPEASRSFEQLLSPPLQNTLPWQRVAPDDNNVALLYTSIIRLAMSQDPQERINPLLEVDAEGSGEQAPNYTLQAIMLFSGKISPSDYEVYLKQLKTLLPYSEQALQSEVFHDLFNVLKPDSKADRSSVLTLLQKRTMQSLQLGQP